MYDSPKASIQGAGLLRAQSSIAINAPNTIAPTNQILDLVNQIAGQSFDARTQAVERIGSLVGYEPSSAVGGAEKSNPPAAWADQIMERLQAIRDNIAQVSYQIGRL